MMPERRGACWLDHLLLEAIDLDHLFAIIDDRFGQVAMDR